MRDAINNSQETAHDNAMQNAYLYIVKNGSGLTNSSSKCRELDAQLVRKFAGYVKSRKRRLSSSLFIK